VGYVKAETILPDDLIKEIQKYIQGEYVYIPSPPNTRKKWGENSGNREYIRNRNEDICKKYRSGCKIKDLAEEYYLSIESIKRIVYAKKP
jgi:DNA-binding NarL/FixJ family response regulator